MFPFVSSFVPLTTGFTTSINMPQFNHTIIKYL